MDLQLEIQPDVARALKERQPVVALESTLITHGLPYPANLETASAMEAAVRQGGSTPATIAILKGRPHVGLSAEQMAYLAERPMAEVRKCSRRDLPLAVAQGVDGATTVAGTIILAHMAGIELFATGGIGGVHRGQPFDISADLTELSRTPVSVVCSGAKSILDLPNTREVLETNGVPLVGYGTDEMPAFFSRNSGLPVDLRVETPAEAAAVIRARRELGLASAALIVVPVPAAEEFNSDDAEAAIIQATADAEMAGIHGPQATPWLLRRVNELTGGASLRANVALLRNNARVASLIAASLANNHTPTAR